MIRRRFIRQKRAASTELFSWFLLILAFCMLCLAFYAFFIKFGAIPAHKIGEKAYFVQSAAMQKEIELRLLDNSVGAAVCSVGPLPSPSELTYPALRRAYIAGFLSSLGSEKEKIMKLSPGLADAMDYSSYSVSIVNGTGNKSVLYGVSLKKRDIVQKDASGNIVTLSYYPDFRYDSAKTIYTCGTKG